MRDFPPWAYRTINLLSRYYITKSLLSISSPKAAFGNGLPPSGFKRTYKFSPRLNHQQCFY